MLYDNVKQSFYTDAGDRPTSVYFVYRNGTMRAKTAEKSLHVRRGKNICFVTEEDGDKILDEEVAKVANTSDTDVTITLGDDSTVTGKKTPGGAYNTPVDFYLEDNGDYNSGLHVGHTITDEFKPGDSGLTIEDIRRVRDEHVNAEDTEITGENGDFEISHEDDACAVERS